MARTKKLAEQHAEITQAHAEREAAFQALGNRNLSDEKRKIAHQRYTDALANWEELNTQFHTKEGA